MNSQHNTVTKSLYSDINGCQNRDRDYSAEKRNKISEINISLNTYFWQYVL